MRSCLLLLIIALIIEPRSESFQYRSHPWVHQKYAHITMHIYRGPLKISSIEERRNFLQSISFVASTAMVFNKDFYAHAAILPSNSSSIDNGTTQQNMLKTLLSSVPVFTIVDPDGIPFMVVGEDAKISCYFFTTYAEADRLLSLARSSVDRTMNENNKEVEDNELSINPWKVAQISSVSLAFAVALVQRGKIGGAYFYIAPADTDVQDALDLSPKVKELSEGKVPLFYMENFTIDGIATKRNPLYFRKADLLHEWRKYNLSRNQDPPPIQVTELFAVLKLLLASTQEDDDIRSIVLIPPVESIQKAEECKARLRQSQAFQLGKRILVL